MMKVSMKGFREVEYAFAEFPSLTQDAIRNGFQDFGQVLTQDLQQKINRQGKRGRLYRVRGQKRRYRASAANQFPATRTGNLKKSVRYEVKGSSYMEFGVTDNAPYAEYLQLGTSRMAARKLVREISEQNANLGRDILTKHIQKAVK